MQQRYVNQAEENRAANEASYAAWLKEYTPLQIKQANSARKHLRRLGHSKFYGIQDERLVKAPLNTYMFFLKERHDSSDFKHLPVKDAALRIAEEWKSLTDSEKQVSCPLFLQTRSMIVGRTCADHNNSPTSRRQSVTKSAIARNTGRRMARTHLCRSQRHHLPRRVAYT